MRAFISTLQTLISIAPCAQIFEHQSLEDEDSEEEEEEGEGTASADKVVQQPQASTSTAFEGPSHCSDSLTF